MPSFFWIFIITLVYNIVNLAEAIMEAAASCLDVEDCQAEQHINVCRLMLSLSLSMHVYTVCSIYTDITVYPGG
jgi:hypothetical protein